MIDKELEEWTAAQLSRSAEYKRKVRALGFAIAATPEERLEAWRAAKSAAFARFAHEPGARESWLDRHPRPGNG